MLGGRGKPSGDDMALVHRVGWDARFMQRSPWFWPLAGAAARFEAFQDWPSAADYDALYAELALPRGAAPLRFAANVRKEDKRANGRIVLEALYDGRIARGEVPTRERDWHDFFNALCFATFPLAKRALHARQFAALSARVSPNDTQLPNARTPEQDALTLFDEGGTAIAADPSALAELAAAPDGERDAKLVQLTAAGRARAVPFGHALFEHLVEGLRCPGGCSQLLELPAALVADARAETELLAAVDAGLGAVLADPERLRSPRQCAHIRLSLPSFAVGPAPSP